MYSGLLYPIRMWLLMLAFLAMALRGRFALATPLMIAPDPRIGSGLRLESSCWIDDPAAEVDQRRLTCTIRTRQGEFLSGRDRRVGLCAWKTDV
jgi:hypothetical protein